MTFEELRRELCRDVPYSDMNTVDRIINTLAVCGVDLKRIYGGVLKIIPRDPTAEMVAAATETEGVKEVSDIIRTHAITGRGKLTYHLKGMPPPIIQAWHAMWDASK